MKIDSLYFVYPGDLNTPTGGYRYDRRLIQELQALGIRVHPIALSDAFPYPDTKAIEEAHRAFMALPDNAIVIVDGLALGTLDNLAEAESRRLNLIALCHHPLALESGLDPEQQTRFQRSEERALRAAHAVVVTSHHTRQILINQFSLRKKPVTVALPGNDRVPFAPCEGHPPRLLTVASLTRRKAHDVLIDALASVAGLPWHARFIGSPDLDLEWSDRLRHQTTHQRLQDRIDLVGATDDLDDEFHQADIFVLPSRFEGYGMVFAEALAAGLPIIAARAGAVPDVVPESAGILVPPDDPAALGDALRTLLTREDRRRVLQAGAREAAAALPSWADTADCVLQLAESLHGP